MSEFKNYADPLTLCGKANAQMCSAMAMDFAIKGAIMPDCHAGYALPIGAVVETEGVIVPAWVGYDIGCGMSSSITNIKAEEVEPFKEAIRDLILISIPVGNNRHKTPTWSKFEEDLFSKLTEAGKTIFRKRAVGQLGTLGGGNHFIEIGKSREGFIAITIHSGSRGLGHGLAGHYMKVAALANGVHKGNVEGHFGLKSGDEGFNDYLNDALLAQEYALMNRKSMSEAVQTIISHVISKPVSVTEFINRNHNHVDVTTNGTYIHRKGATHAEESMMGVIPGNMRDGCFIVKGKGNPDSLCSSSHGAGRVLSRGAAKEQLDVEMFEQQMVGIAGVVGEKTLDEAPDAYKDIFEVMDLQKDLVEITDYLKPLINVKG